MPKIDAPKDRFNTNNGVKIHYLDWGGTSKETILFAHGIGGNAHYWDDIAKALRSDYRVLAIDHRGHGDSDHPLSGYSPTSFAEDVHALVKALGIAPFYYVGHSLGGRIGSGYAGLYPKELKKLVLVDGGPQFSDKPPTGFTDWMATWPRGFPSREAAVKWAAENKIGTSDAMRESFVKNSLRKNWVGQYVWKMDMELLWMPFTYTKEENDAIWGRLKTIRCPALVIRGSKSAVFEEKFAVKLAEMLPKGKLLTIEGAGHAVAQDRPAEFLKVIKNFLSK